MLFQGQEFASSAPFLFFADHEPELAHAGSQRPQGIPLAVSEPAQTGNRRATVADPGRRTDFERCKLDHGERRANTARSMQLHRDLTRASARAIRFPLRHEPRSSMARCSRPRPSCCAIFGRDGDDRLLLVNLGSDLTSSRARAAARAARQNAIGKCCWSSEDPHTADSGRRPSNRKWMDAAGESLRS